MPKFKVVISLGVNSYIIDAENKDQAVDKAGEEMVKELENIKLENFVEVYEATAEDIAEIEKEKSALASGEPS